jgi:hypothetical protein
MNAIGVFRAAHSIVPPPRHPDSSRFVPEHLLCQSPLIDNPQDPALIDHCTLHLPRSTQHLQRLQLACLALDLRQRPL